ncbi:MAG: uroporphyrinogen-III C-methyltransferase [Cyanobacterium sp.]
MTIYFVGAGVGGIDYLTVKAHGLICRADVVIYDALADDEILKIIPPYCVQVDVGKRGGMISTPQDTINQMLVDYGQVYDIVIRLKSGDPGIFGRLNPELEAIAPYNIPYELVPGVSSILAAPLLAGLSLTEKNNSQHFAVISGHNPDSLNWKVLAQIDTLVILMGAKNLPIIINNLLKYRHEMALRDRTQDFPITIIKNAGRNNQQIWRGTLDNILQKTEGIALSPCVIVIGNLTIN